jgi:carbamoyl-phosphate synthase small subunit
MMPEFLGVPLRFFLGAFPASPARISLASRAFFGGAGFDEASFVVLIVRSPFVAGLLSRRACQDRAPQEKPMTDARLALADGTVLRGRSVGAAGTVAGEAVFNTGMAGYQEVLSDPSYRGQLVTMTYPEVGNYGINLADMESDRVQVAGFIMRNCCQQPSNFRAESSLPDFLREHGIVAIDDIDTRLVTKRLRVDGAMNAVLSTDASLSDAQLVEQARGCPDMLGQDLASAVGCSEAYDWTEASAVESFGPDLTWPPLEDEALVVAIDLGIKRNILRLLRACGLRVRVVPAQTPASEILALQPAGIFVSNGPGDPAPLQAVHETLRQLIDADLPMFGICLGHQVLALALGAKSFKLKFGHRGVNHPIQRLANGAVEIASHNHGFAVDADSLPAEVELTHVNLNDGTCAGLAHRSKPIFSVQYHPEAGPGPSDPLYLFRQFADSIRSHCSA